MTASDAAFQKWFKGSSVVDAKGQPLVVYHGSREDDLAEISAMDTSYGLFFAPDPRTASYYAGKDCCVYAAYLRIKKLADFDDEVVFAEVAEMALDVDDVERAREAYGSQDFYINYQDGMLRAAENMGYDGVVMTDPSSVGEPVSYVVFDPKQVKIIGQVPPAGIAYNPPAASNPHQLLPEPDVVESLRKAASDFWVNRNSPQKLDAMRVGIGVLLPGGRKRWVPILAHLGGQEYAATYDPVLKEIVVDTGKAKSATVLFYLLLHEAIHAVEFLSQPRLADAVVGRYAGGHEKIGSKAQQHLEYYLRQVEINAYTIVFIQMACDLLDQVESEKLRIGVPRAFEVALALQKVARKSGAPVHDAGEVVQDFVNRLPRNELVDALDEEMEHQYFYSYANTGEDRDSAWATFDLQRSFANKLWYAMEEWKARNTRAAKKGGKR